jgi:hypothetical protein
MIDGGTLVKSAMILAALCAAFCVSTPAVQAKGMTDMDMYCKILPMTAKCKAPAPAKPVAAVPMAKPAAMKMAMAKPAPKPMAMGMKMMGCVPAPAGSKFFLTCNWK